MLGLILLYEYRSIGLGECEVVDYFLVFLVYYIEFLFVFCFVVNYNMLLIVFVVKFFVGDVLLY